MENAPAVLVQRAGVVVDAATLRGGVVVDGAAVVQIYGADAPVEDAAALLNAAASPTAALTLEAASDAHFNVLFNHSAATSHRSQSGSDCADRISETCIFVTVNVRLAICVNLCSSVAEC
jgi:hypothetical protein